MKKFFTVLLTLSMIFVMGSVCGATRIDGCVDCEKGLAYIDYKNVDESFCLLQSETFFFNLNTDKLLVGDIKPGDKILSANLKIEFEDSFAFAQLKLDSATEWSHKWLFGDQEYSFNVLSEVLPDHSLQVKVSSFGFFKLDDMELKGCYQPVPEPGTMLLLGFGLVGLWGLGRKRLFR